MQDIYPAIKIVNNKEQANNHYGCKNDDYRPKADIFPHQTIVSHR
jgi:hypothetical protein